MVVGTNQAMARQRSKKKKKHFVPAVAMYAEGKCDKLKAHMYNMVPRKNGFDIFAKTTTEIGQYIACTIPNAWDLPLSCDPRILVSQTLLCQHDQLIQLI
jgi:hypothetical protein